MKQTTSNITKTKWLSYVNTKTKSSTTLQSLTSIIINRSIEIGYVRGVPCTLITLIAQAMAEEWAGVWAERERARTRGGLRCAPPPAPRPAPLALDAPSTRPSTAHLFVRRALHSTLERRENTSRFPPRRYALKFAEFERNWISILKFYFLNK